MEDMKLSIYLCLLIVVTTALCSTQAFAEETPKVEYNQYYTYSNYSTGERSDINSSFLVLHLPNSSKIWYGYQSTAYTEPPRLFGLGKYLEDYHTAGGYFTYKNRFSYQVDYFRLTNSLGHLTTVGGGEFIHRLGNSFSAGAAYYSTSSPFYTVRQFNARLFYFPCSTLSFNTKLYITDSTDSRSGTAVQERINWQMSPSVGLQLRGATGRRINAVDNDISSFYTQYAPLLSSYGAFVNCNINGETSFVLGYNRDDFEGYHVEGFQGGLKVYF